MRYFFILSLFTVIVLSMNSCDKDRFYMGSDPVLTFEEDTLTFDTVFTTVGTITRYFKVNNTSKQNLLIDKISIVEGSSSPFRINVDGVSVLGSSIEDVEILAEDYIYIFVEARLGENNASDPLILINELQYAFGNVVQSSYLQAWGQDAYFHFGEVLENENVVWPCDKPHVIVRNSDFPGLGVDSFSTLTINPGCVVYMGQNAGLFVDGELHVGLPNNMDSVTFQSARIEDLPNGLEFENTAGLWYGIGMFGGSIGTFYNARIRQATYGITGRFVQGDYTTYASTRPDITIDKTIISTCLANAIIALNSKLRVSNSVFHSAGSHLVALALGGDYEFDNCTLYNSGGPGLSHEDETLAISNFASNGSSGGVSDLDNASFTNCIVYGGLSEELVLNNESLGNFNYQFTNCLIRTDLNTDTVTFSNCISDENPLFESTNDRDFRLTENSPCIDAGADNSALILDDILFQSRGLPNDIGAFEYSL